MKDIFPENIIQINTENKKTSKNNSNNMDIDIVIANDKRLPLDINPNYTFLTKNRFIKEANSDAGLEIEHLMYINLDVVDEAMYDAMKTAIDDGRVKFYKFDDQFIYLPYIKEDIKVYKL